MEGEGAEAECACVTLGHFIFQAGVDSRFSVMLRSLISSKYLSETLSLCVLQLFDTRLLVPRKLT